MKVSVKPLHTFVWDISCRFVAAVIFAIACCAFSAAKEFALPELDWGSLSSLTAAEQAYNESRYQDAIRLYTEACKDSSERSVAVLGRGMAYEMVNQPQKASEDYRKAIELDPSNYRAMENLAGIYERNGKFISEAITLYTNALKLDPRPEWKENLTVWIAMLETRLQPQASSAVGCWHLANRKARAGEVQEAEALYSKAIRLNPVMFQAYYSRGLLRRNIGKLSEAVADLESTVRISPTFRGGYVQKGLINEQMGNLENARHDFEEAAKVDPRDPEALYHLARFLEIAGEPVRAVQLYQKALGLRPKPELHKLIMDRIASLQDAVKQAASKGSAQPDNSRRLW